MAGLKKWVPSTSAGRLVAPAISSMSRVEVFEASIAPGFITASSLPKTSFLTGISSNTASMTMSASAIWSYSSAGVMRSMRVSTASAARLPRFTLVS